MLLSLWTNWWEDWSLYHKATFDGVNKLIIINPEVTSFDIKRDLYSSWKEWSSLRDNTKFLPAVRTTGGDPIGGGQFTGDVYFLINGWRIFVDHSCQVTGVIYSDDFPSPFVQADGTQIVTNTVSALVNVVSTSGSTVDVPTASEVATAVWTNGTRTLTSAPAYNGPTAVQIRQEMDTNSTKLNTLVSNTTSIPTAGQVATAVRTELTTELSRIDVPVSSISVQGGLSAEQADMLLRLYEIMGLDPTKPLIVTQNQRIAGDITQTIQTSSTQTIVTRV